MLLDGQRYDEQMEGLKTLLRAMGELGIGVMGYNFSLAGVYGRVTGNYGRGAAGGVGMEGFVDEEPMLDGMVWNMTFDECAVGTAERTRGSTTPRRNWRSRAQLSARGTPEMPSRTCIGFGMSNTDRNPETVAAHVAE